MALSRRPPSSAMKPSPPPPPPFLAGALILLLLLLPSPTSSATTKASAPSPTPSITKGAAASPEVTPAAPSPAAAVARPSSSASTLDPKQLTALQSLDIPTARDPCTQQPQTTTCDGGKPFRHLISLRLANCSGDTAALSFTALKALSTLSSLSFFNCPVSPIRFPTDLSLNLRSFSAVRSLRRLTGVWLSRLVNLTDLTVSDVPVNASGPYVILGNLKLLKSITVSRTNLTGSLPKHWHANLTHVDFSGNQLKDRIPNSITLLENIQSLNLSSNHLTGEIPAEIGDLILLKNLSLSSNSLSGSVPGSMSAIPGLVSVDLSSNQLNGTVPKFFSGMKNLKYLNLAGNNFHGVMPFNESFIKKLEVFKIGDNSNLCYNHSTFSSKVKLGIAQCDKHGLPMLPPPSKASSTSDEDSSDGTDDSADSSSTNERHRGPSKFVLGVAIALASIVFLIVFLVLLSKCCK